MGIYLKVKQCYTLEISDSMNLEDNILKVSGLTWNDIKEKLGDSWVEIENESFYLSQEIGNVIDIIDEGTIDGILIPMLTILPKDTKEFYRMDDTLDKLLINKFNQIKYINWDFSGENPPKVVTKTGAILSKEYGYFIGKDSYKNDLPDEVKKEFINKGVVFDKPFYEQYHTRAINRVVNLAKFIGLSDVQINRLRFAVVVYEN
jgi:hypothetical protein